MKILIAEDEAVSRRLLEVTLKKWGYDVVGTRDGTDAWNQLQQPDAPALLILDWLMPGMDGVEICRRLRQRPGCESTYVILLTAKGDKDDIVEGLDAGADDYVTKPFNSNELRARVQVGARVVSLQQRLAHHVQELTEALSRVKQLHRLLPICAYCKKIRDDRNYWHQVESYIGHYADVRFSHGVCPECSARIKADLRGDSRSDDPDSQPPPQSNLPSTL